MDKKDHQQQQQLSQEQLEHVAGGRIIGSEKLGRLALGFEQVSEKLAALFAPADAARQKQLVPLLMQALGGNKQLPLAEKLAAVKQLARAQGVECSDEALVALLEKDETLG